MIYVFGLKRIGIGLLLLGVCLANSGCRKGDKGDPGTSGSLLGGESFHYAGSITADPTLVNISNFTADGDDFVSVYVCKASGSVGVPCDQLGGDTGATVYYKAQRNSISIENAAANGYLTYSVTAIIK